MNVVTADTGDAEQERSVAIDRIAGGLMLVYQRVPFIEDPAVMPTVMDIIAEARRADVRDLRPVLGYTL